MADDARISTALPKHFKTLKLKRRLGADGCWSLICLFLWVAENKPTGDLAGMSDEEIEIVAQWEGDIGAFMSNLVDVGFIDGEPNERAVHDWQEHNPWAASRGARIAAARDAASRKWGNSTPESRATRSQRMAEARAKGRHSAADWHTLVAVCGGVCVRCGGGGPLVKDHIVPIYQGGSDGIDNLQPLCKSCNSSKGPDATDHRPANWLNRLQMAMTSLQRASEMPADGSSNKDEVPAHHPTQPNPTQPNQKSIAAAPPAKRSTQLPAQFDLTDEMRQFARQQGVADPSKEFAAFCDYHRSKGSTFKDWQAAWRTWARNASKFSGGKGKAPPAGYLNETHDDLLAALQRQTGEVQ